MLNVSKECKDAFLSAEQKTLVLLFDDGTKIDNDDIALESMNLEQTLCESEELRYGKVCSACFKTKISASTKRYKDLWFNASISVGEHEIKLGRFKVHSDNMTSDRVYRDIVAYDALFWAINTDVTEWYKGLKFPLTQKQFRDSLFDFIGVEQAEVVLPNDEVVLEKTVDVEGLTGLMVLQALCELNATWGTINNEGLFKYARMRTHKADALYPSDDLYPSDKVFPNDVYDDSLTKANYYQGTLKYAEYDTSTVSKVVIRESADDVGFVKGEEGNTYIIENNFLTYGLSNETLDAIADNFLDYASYLTYTPSELKCKGAPWREVGDLLRVVADKRTLTVPILNRRMSGITGLKDIYIAKGKETYGENKTGTMEQLKQLQGRTNKLTRDLDGTRSEVAKKVNGEDVVSVINQSAEEILLKGNRIVIDSDKWKVNADGSQICSDINIEGGSIELSSESNSVAKITIRNSTTGQYCTISPGACRWYNAKGNLVTDLFAAMSILSLKTIDKNGSITASTGITSTGITTTGGIGAGRVSINTEVSYATPLYVNGDAQILGTTTLASSPVISSDRDLKKDIEEITSASSFIYSLKPCKYRYKDGTSNRYHHGFIAQEVKESMGDEDWGVYIEGNTEENSHKGLRYEELIADLVATIQEQNERIKALEERVGI